MVVETLDETQARFLAEMMTRAPPSGPGALPEVGTPILTRGQSALAALRATMDSEPGQLANALATGMELITQAESLSLAHPRYAASLRGQALLIALDMGRRIDAFGKRFDAARVRGVLPLMEVLESEFSEHEDRVIALIMTPHNDNTSPTDRARRMWPPLFGMPIEAVLVCIDLHEMVSGTDSPLLEVLNRGLLGTSFARLCAIVR